MFQSDADFIEQLIQPLTVAVMQMEMVLEKTEQSKKELLNLKSALERMRSLSVARRDQVLRESKEAV